MNGAFGLLERLLAIVFLAALCLSFGGVIGRYGFGRGLPWADEVQVYVIIAMTFLGAAVASWRNTHLRMDAVSARFSLRARAWTATGEAVFVLALSGLTAWQSTTYVLHLRGLDQRSDAAGIPLWLPHGCVAAGFALVTLVALVRVVGLMRGASRPSLVPPGAAP